MSAAKIRELNDQFRKDPLRYGRLVITRSIMENEDETFAPRVVKAVQEFDAFENGNDPYAEHDFIAVEVSGEKIFAKIDYYDRTLTYGSEDPSDPSKTMRVMTIMLAEDY